MTPLFQGEEAYQSEDSDTVTVHQRVWAELRCAARTLVRIGTASQPHPGDRRGPGQARTHPLIIGGRIYHLYADVPSEESNRQPLLVIAVQRSASEYLSGDQLQREFRLTRAEANVALLLAQRRRNREIAQELGVSEHTARRHTEKVMGKLGVHRRTDVWQAILSVGQQSILPRRRSQPYDQH